VTKYHHPKPTKPKYTASHKKHIRSASIRMQAATHAIATHEGDHMVKRTIAEEVLYPPHAARTESAAYVAVHHDLVHVRKLPCMVCGVSVDTIHDPAHNPFGATALETHHHMVEWALSNAIDVEKFNVRIVRMLHARNHRDPKYQDPSNPANARRFTRQEMIDWIDHDPDNLWVLCDVHHRHRDVGIHMVTGPIWGAQDLLLQQYQLGVQAARARGAKAVDGEHPEELPHADDAPADDAVGDTPQASAPHADAPIQPTELQAAEVLFTSLLKGLFTK
jgi:hypothetical protein